MSLKIALLNPSINIAKRYGIFKDFQIPVIPLGLGYLAGYIRDKGYNTIKIFDEQISSLENKQTFQSLIDFQPDIAGISCLTIHISRTFEIASKIREFLPHTKIIVGSAHPTLEPEYVIKNKTIDFILRGEGEKSFHSFLESFKTSDYSRVKGLSYMNNGQIIHNDDVVPIADLDILPTFPYYLFANEKSYELGRYVSSRGCPYRCIFCSSRYISGKKYRVHSAERVVDDLEMLVKKYGVKYVQFHDDNINFIKSRVQKICELILSRGLKFRWATQTRSDSLDLELLKLMKRAGCAMMGLGIETGSERLMKLIQKDETLEDHIKAVEMLKKAGINISGAFILGFPTETREETIQTINFAKRLKLDGAMFALAVPYPGTKLLDLVRKEGKALNWDSFSPSGGYGNNRLAYVPEGRNEEEMSNFQKKANVRHWLSLKRIYKIVVGEISPYAVPQRITLKELIKIIRFLIRYTLSLLKE
jgi:radical SAM superfamily enzyme YgiQ (UPF0313 family)